MQMPWFLFNNVSPNQDAPLQMPKFPSFDAPANTSVDVFTCKPVSERLVHGFLTVLLLKGCILFTSLMAYLVIYLAGFCCSMLIDIVCDPNHNNQNQAQPLPVQPMPHVVNDDNQRKHSEYKAGNNFSCHPRDFHHTEESEQCKVQITVKFHKKTVHFVTNRPVTLSELCQLIDNESEFPSHLFQFYHNGKLLKYVDLIQNSDNTLLAIIPGLGGMKRADPFGNGGRQGKVIKKCYFDEENDCSKSKYYNIQKPDDIQKFSECYGIDQSTSQNQYVLCNKHYQRMKKYEKPRNCAVCQKLFESLSRNPCLSSYSRSIQSLDEEIVRNLMVHKHGDKDHDSLSRHSMICTTCWKHAKEIPANILIRISSKQPAPLPEISTGSIPDSSLVFESALYATAHDLANSFKRNRCMLLQNVFEIFQIHVTYHQRQFRSKYQQECNLTSYPTKPNMLEKLQVIFKNKIITHKFSQASKMGTMLYFPGMDLAEAIHTAMYHEKYSEKSFNLTSSRMESRLFELEKSLDEEQNFYVMLSSVCKKLNEHVLTQCKQNIEKYRHKWHKLDKIDLIQLMNDMDPVIWNMIIFLTANKSERQRLMKLESSEFDWTNHHTTSFNFESNADIRAFTQKFFLAYSLIFCTDQECGYPLHVLLSDFVNCYSQSDELNKVLNRLGVCVSKSTHKRFVQSISSMKETESNITDLISDAFSVVSIDNIDKLNPGAAIRSDDSQRCWNGTSVMAQQPMPNTIKDPSNSHQNMSVSNDGHGSEEHINLSDASDLGVDCQSENMKHSSTDYNSTLSTDDDNTISKSQISADKPNEFCDQSANFDTNLASCTTMYKPPQVEHDLSKIPPKTLKTEPLRKRARTLKEKDLSEMSTTRETNGISHPVPFDNQPLNEGFQNLTPEEGTAWDTFKHSCDLYVFEREVNSTSYTEMFLPGLKCKLYLDDSSSRREKSNMVYLDVLSKHADNIETVKEVIDRIYDLLCINKGYRNVVIAGDAKTYQHLISLKFEYGNDLDWLVPFIGDWHCLKNYQEVLNKVYWDAGLKNFAQELHHGLTLTSLESCSNFRRNHDFLMQVWEALYRYQIDIFLQHKQGTGLQVDVDSIVSHIKRCVSQLKDSKKAKYKNVTDFLAMQEELQQSIGGLQSEFFEFVESKCNESATFKLWSNFLSRDMMSYIALWIAIRSGNWNLRNASLKTMLPNFVVCDRQNYGKILPRHFSHLFSMPQEILDCFKSGGFVTSIKGIPFANVALDEAHEMTINKDIKSVISRPDQSYIKPMTHYLPYRAKLMLNFRQEIGLPQEDAYHKDLKSSIINMEEDNIKLYKQKAIESRAFQCEEQANNNIRKLFSETYADAQQHHDLMNFHEEGKSIVRDFIKCSYFKDSSVKISLRRRNLKTFHVKKNTKKAMKSVERDQNLLVKCYKRMLAFSKRNKTPIDDIGQLLELPRAIAQDSGLPYKGNKAFTTTFYESRYKDKCPNLFRKKIDKSECQHVILEGMFLINSVPLASCNTFADYADFLMRRWILVWFNRGAKRIDILFDDAGRHGLTGKDLERQRRDGENDHQSECPHDVIINHDTKLPNNWRSFLSDRPNKKALCKFLSHHISSAIGKHLGPTQSFCVTGSFDSELQDKAVVVTIENGIVIDDNLEGNHEETDSRIWLHVCKSPFSNILVYSPDTDTYHIGLPFVSANQSVLIQLNNRFGDEKYLDLNLLRTCLDQDPELCSIDSKITPYYIQMLYIVSGCDYTSHFVNRGKCSFFKWAFQFSNFVCNGYYGHNLEVHKFQPDNMKKMLQCSSCAESINFCQQCQNYFLAFKLPFLRLIGCVYFFAFLSAYSPCNSPVDLFRKHVFEHPGISPEDSHIIWLNDIRLKSWERVEFEDQTLPSTESLSFHILRTLWVALVWHQAKENTVFIPLISKFGWVILNDNVHVIWDTPENLAKVRQRVEYLTRGCKCKTGCKNRICKCKKRGVDCGPGCSCINCTNSGIVMDQDEALDLEISLLLQSQDNNTSLMTIDDDHDECNQQNN